MASEANRLTRNWASPLKNNINQWLALLEPLADGINSWTLGGVPVFLQSGQLSGSQCQIQGLVIRDFSTMCACTCQHYYAIFMHSACVHVHM